MSNPKESPMELGKAIETIEILDTAVWIAPEEVEALTTLTEHARRSLDAPKAEVKEDAGGPDNLWIATRLVEQIVQVRSVLTELRAAFARSELDGGTKAAPRHPLYIQAQERLADLHEQLMMVI